MADPTYTTAGAVNDLAGELAIDLRTDDGSEATLVASAIDYASGRIDFYTVPPYSQTALAASRWIRDVATIFALHWLCLRRLNEAPASLETERKERLDELHLIKEGKASVPGVARSRRPVTVTNQRIDLRRLNNQPRSDRARSTGAPGDYRRPTDPEGEALGDR